jgi:hypothetical protein
LNSRHCPFARVHFEITGTMSFSVKGTETVVHDVRPEKIVVLCSIPICAGMNYRNGRRRADLVF